MLGKPLTNRHLVGLRTAFQVSVYSGGGGRHGQAEDVV